MLPLRPSPSDELSLCFSDAPRLASAGYAAKNLAMLVRRSGWAALKMVSTNASSAAAVSGVLCGVLSLLHKTFLTVTQKTDGFTHILFLSGNSPILLVQETSCYFAQQQNKTADGLSQYATRKAPAQPPTGSELVSTNTLASLQIRLIKCSLSRAIEGVAGEF